MSFRGRGLVNDGRVIAVRDNAGHILVTTCLILDKGGLVVSRGISICARIDYPNKRIGRLCAFGRARYAIKMNEADATLAQFGPVVRPEAILTLFDCGLVTDQAINQTSSDPCVPAEWQFKCEWRPSQLSDREWTALERHKRWLNRDLVEKARPEERQDCLGCGMPEALINIDSAPHSHVKEATA